MKRVIVGAAVSAFAALPVYSEPQRADIWIGIPGGENGFLIDQSTGDLWMTGHCLKALRPARLDGTVWTSQTVELVSVGRARALLDQTFILDVDPRAPSITVENSDRGGVQHFAADVVENCRASRACAVRMETPAC